MASETTFSNIRTGYSISKFYYDAALKDCDRDSFAAWFFDELKKWPAFDTFFSEVSGSTKLINSLCHTSFEHENIKLGLSSYERLEFLGDAVLDLLVSQNLLKLYPKLNEGELSKLRGALVNEDNLSLLARTLDLGQLILLGRGEFQNKGYEKNAILADVVESTIAVLYLEQGLVGAQKYFDSMTQEYEKKLGVNFFALTHMETFDSKTKLQERTMALFKVHPVYNFNELKSGKFEVVVTVKGQELARLTHSSKKKAEKILAHKIMTEKLYEEVQNVN